MKVERIVKSYPIRIEGGWVGQDISLTVYGGARPHVGAVALSVMGSSPHDPRRRTCSENVLTVQGHKESDLARTVATRLAKLFDCTVSVTCGIHYPNITAEDIRMVLSVVNQLTDECARVLLDEKERSV
ncbi:MAG: hypothetical protein MI749_17865 [Desulfovibrionales bacterium]|nr:hypothetical protein [Desulfovibrionales bacterium]